MDPSLQRLQFLDLSETTETEQSLIERVLFAPHHSLQVPWCTDSTCGNEEDTSVQEWVQPTYAMVQIPAGVYMTATGWLQAGQDEPLHSPHSVRHDHEPCLTPEALGQQEGPLPVQGGLEPPRGGPVYTGPPASLPHQMYQVMSPMSNVFVSNVTANVNVHPPYMAPYGHQMTAAPQPQPAPYPHSPETEHGSRPPRQRGKNDKKSFAQPGEVMEHPQYSPLSYYLPSPPGTQLYMAPGVVPIYPHPHPGPMFSPYGPSPAPMVYTHPAPPSSDDYQDNSEIVVVQSEETYAGRPNGTYQPETVFHHEEQSVVPDTERFEPPPEQPVTPEPTEPKAETKPVVNQSHEHMCYHTEVVVKLPKKKPAPVPVSEADARVTPKLKQAPGHSDFPSISSKSEELEIKSPPPTQTWASLFSRPDGGGGTPNSTDTKSRPLATVQPFEAEPATPGLRDAKSVESNGRSVRQLSSADDPHLYEVGEWLSKYKLNHKIVNLQPRGLTNRGNWCYINATLQALIACPPFYNLLNEIPSRSTTCSQTLIIDALVNFVKEFSTLPANARIGKREKSARNKEESGQVEIAAGAAFEPTGIYKILDKVRGGSSFSVEGRQEDAEEFLSCLLNGVNDEMTELMKLEEKANVPNGDSNGLTAEQEQVPEDEDEAEWNVMGPKNKSSVTRRAVCGKTPLSDIFRGQMRSRLQRAGDQCTDNVQPFFTLQLDMEKASSVKAALDLLVDRDTLEGMTCSKTHQQVEAWTQSTLEELPLVLILHLKCFDYKSDGGCSKITKNVEVSIDLKIDPRLMPVKKSKHVSGKDRSYKLVAVVYHDGKEATKGHYVTDAYHIGYGSWIRYDDGVVRAVPEQQVLRPHSPRMPYLLYYRRADTIGPK